MKIIELHLKNEKKDPSRDGWVYFNKPGKGLSIYRWPSGDEYPEIDHLILEDDKGYTYKCTIDKNLLLHKECICIPVEWNGDIATLRRVNLEKKEGESCPPGMAPRDTFEKEHQEYINNFISKSLFPIFKGFFDRNPEYLDALYKKKEFTYEPLCSSQRWTQGVMWGNPIVLQETKSYSIKVCDKVFEINSGMRASDVISLFESVNSHMKNEIGYNYRGIFTYSKGCPRFYVTIHNDDVDYTHHVTHNMDPKDILDIMMKVCERVEKYIKEGK